MKKKAGDSMALGERIVYARNNKGLNQKQFAELIGVTPSKLGSWERGERDPNVSLIQKIIKALEVSEDWLLGNDDNSSMKNLTENQQDIKLTKEQQKLVADNEHIIGTILRSIFHKRLCIGKNIEEFYGDAAIGLCEAAKRYDKSKEKSFYSFAFTCIEWKLNIAHRKSNKDLQPSISLDQLVGLGDDELGTLIPAPDEWEPLEYKILVESVYQKVEPVLETNQKEIFRLWLHGKEEIEMARAMGISYGMVRTRICRAKKKCRDSFSADEIFS